MLTSLQVRNFALIDRLELTFGAGLNILTGETGAGKSIIVDALGVVLGDRSSVEMIRSGADKMSVEAAFTVADAPQSTRDRLAENGLENDDDPDTLIVARELNKSGKSQSRINGRLISTAILRSVGRELVDFHGQHEHQSLLMPETHVDLLDNWLGATVVQLRKDLSAGHAELVSKRREMELLVSESRERARNIDLYRFQAHEIADAELKADEMDRLTADRSRLANAEKLQQVASESYQALSSTAADALRSVISPISRLATVDPALQPILDQITESASYLEEAVTRLRRYTDTLDDEPGKLESINERLNAIYVLQRKYGDTIEEILAYQSELNRKLASLEGYEERESELRAELNALEGRVSKISDELSQRRRAGGTSFAEAIMAELLDLGMSKTVLEVKIEPTMLGARGSDKVEFLISTNAGEPLRPLARIASGGETSRLMLAIKSVLARSSSVPTMVFDEIDTGIGGRTGRVLADKLASLGDIAQILCITHLPQIASRRAAEHFFIQKCSQGERTTVTVVPLSPTERELEIARMLGGEDSHTVLLHAREMLSAK